MRASRRSWAILATCLLVGCANETTQPSSPAPASQQPTPSAPAISQPAPSASSAAVRPSNCPTASVVKVADVIATSATDPVGCFGAATLTFTAVVAPLGGEGLPAMWLTREPVCVLATTTERCPTDLATLYAYADPAKIPGSALPTDGAHWFQVVGHFDDPRAQLCTTDIVPVDFGDPIEVCRHRFVITSLTPVAAP